MKQQIKPIKFAEIDTVIIEPITKTPYCTKHGAMNKVNNFEDSSGYWRCLTVSSQENNTVCRSGCHF